MDESAAVIEERARCLRIIEHFQCDLKRFGLFEALWNRIANADYDPGAPDFEDDRLPGT